MKAGIYKHYKGALVLVLGTARHTETKETLVAYIPLAVKTGPRINVRPYDMFFEHVKIASKDVPRFTYIGEAVDSKLSDQYDHLSGYKGKDRIND